MRQPIPFGKYLLLDRISVGGMAEVFKAKSYGVEGFEKVIAIKRILPSMGEDRDFIKMFIDEAKIAGQLAHANICQIFELGRIEGDHFIAMEYIWGRDLLQISNRFRKRKQQMPVPMACYVLSKVCEGLDYAHRKKDPLGRPLEIVHRDCSPQNVLVSYEGEVKIIDFGIAKAASRSSRTMAGVLKGKFGYMSPEQVRGLPLDRRTDIFALGTVLYECVTGERLFHGESDFSILEKVRNVDITPPSRINGNIPSEVEQIIMKALSRDPDERYQWCVELQADLHAYLMSRPSVFSAKALSAWLKEAFAAELEHEQAAMESYRQLGRDGLIAGEPQASARVDLVEELGELPPPDDPTILGGPSFEDMLAAHEAGEAPPERVSQPAATEQTPSDEQGRAPTVPVESESEAADRVLAFAAPRDHDRSDGVPDASMSSEETSARLRSDADGEGGVVVVPVPKLPTVTSPIAGKRSLLLKDIGIGVGIAAAVLVVFSVGRYLVAGDRSGASEVALATLAVVVRDDDPADVYIDEQKVGRVAGGTLTLRDRRVGTYRVRVTREGSPDCVHVVELRATQPEIVTCSFSSVSAAALADVTPLNRPPADAHSADAETSDSVESDARQPAEVSKRDRDKREDDRREDDQRERDKREADKRDRDKRDRGKRDRGKRDRSKQDKPGDDPATKTSGTDDRGSGSIGSSRPDAERATPAVKYGHFYASTRPWGALVYINGRNTGRRTPIVPSAKLRLRVGKHRVTFVYQGQRFDYWIKIAADKDTSLINKRLPIEKTEAAITP